MCQRKKEAWSLVQQDAETAISIDPHLMKVLLIACCDKVHACFLSLLQPHKFQSVVPCKSGALSSRVGIEAYKAAARVRAASQAGDFACSWQQ